MCPACQYLATRPNATRPHQRQFRCGREPQHIKGIGQVIVDRFLCERCGVRMQRDTLGPARRRLWRAA